jgi:hypothetical protein
LGPRLRVRVALTISIAQHGRASSFVQAPPAKAQQAGKIAHIGYLSVAAGRNSLDETFEQTLQQLGWIINRNIIIEYRYAGGRQDMIAPITEEAIRSAFEGIADIEI